MADLETSVFEVTIGDGGKPGPHIRFEVDLNIGGTASTEGRAQLNAILGKDPETFVPYLVIQASSSTSAATMSDGLNAALQNAIASPADDPMANALGFLLSNARNDRGQLFTPTISHNSDNTILTLDTQPELKEMMSNGLMMVSMQAGALLESKAHVGLLVDVGNTFESIGNSNNLVLDLLSSINVKVELGIPAGMGQTVNQVISQFPLPEEVKKGIAAAALFRSALVRTRFASPHALPDSIKAAIPPSQEMIDQKSMAMMMIPEAEKGVLELIGANSTGTAGIYLLTQHSFVKISFSLPGLAKFLF